MSPIRPLTRTLSPDGGEGVKRGSDRAALIGARAIGRQLWVFSRIFDLTGTDEKCICRRAIIGVRVANLRPSNWTSRAHRLSCPMRSGLPTVLA
jgi:hypothetical protein